MPTNWIVGAILIAAGLATIERKHALASAAARIWLWMGEVKDRDDYAFQYEVLGGAFILAGVVVLLLGLFV